MRLLKLFLNKEKNETTDNYFISLKMATELQKYKTSFLGTVKRIRKEVPAAVKHMKEPLCSTTLYKSGDVAMTVYQGKAQKNAAILSTLHQNITSADNAKKHLKVSKLTMTQNMVLILWIKWQGITLLEFPPKDDLFIRSKT